MEKSNQNYCVILAGGKGRRLWPCSREEHPKQFIDFFGVGRTLLQTTFNRFIKVIPPEIENLTELWPAPYLRAASAPL